MDHAGAVTEHGAAPHSKMHDKVETGSPLHQEMELVAAGLLAVGEMQAGGGGVRLGSDETKEEFGHDQESSKETADISAFYESAVLEQRRRRSKVASVALLATAVASLVAAAATLPPAAPAGGADGGSGSNSSSYDDVTSMDDGGGGLDDHSDDDGPLQPLLM